MRVKCKQMTHKQRAEALGNQTKVSIRVGEPAEKCGKLAQTAFHFAILHRLAIAHSKTHLPWE